MKTGLRIIGFFSLLLVFGCKSADRTATQSDEQLYRGNFYSLHYQSTDKLQAEKIKQCLDQGQSGIAGFFSRDFKKDFDVYIFSDRDSLDAQWQKDWNMPDFKSQCWMVASGIAHRLDILSPRVWQTQACEHDSQDENATRKLILHELVHVFHGQYNPSPTFENIVNIDWFVEGIAVYASEQLDAERYERAKNAIQKGEGPASLADMWKGENRYGFSGSMVKFIDDKYGRDVLTQLIELTTLNEVLGVLEISEEELFYQWKRSFDQE